MPERTEIIENIRTARAAGARLKPCCEIVGIGQRTIQRWLVNPACSDARTGPNTAPPHKLTPEERAEVLRLVALPEYRELSPNQIVPLLADKGIYICSESTNHSQFTDVVQSK